MPTYEYRCANCGAEFEVMQSIKADALTHCEKCGQETLKRIISGGTSLIFKGSGFYLTDYKNKSVDPAASKKENTSTKKETTTSSKAETGTGSKSESGSTSKRESKSESKTETKKESKSDSSKTATPAKSSEK